MRLLICLAAGFLAATPLARAVRCQATAPWRGPSRCRSAVIPGCGCPSPHPDPLPAIPSGFDPQPSASAFTGSRRRCTHCQFFVIGNAAPCLIDQQKTANHKRKIHRPSQLRECQIDKPPRNGLEPERNTLPCRCVDYFYEHVATWFDLNFRARRLNTNHPLLILRQPGTV